MPVIVGFVLLCSVAKKYPSVCRVTTPPFQDARRQEQVRIARCVIGVEMGYKSRSKLITAGPLASTPPL
jgi:hypothetical protein